ncbi:SAM-dependent methyltransferase [Streptoalloteichus tenebrarius]|uniref:SAM-dependent methyltransferase n=1 Tax=Streptoalloteichus tenebrarius (strain ATCC 17920 / DSM 40477 / JCM 4838 / CBS 697.72 / NBRC 16177 / NCIMB 11028 / NRRL B-12390 / A12253. 1 / ISP 5477) TaxID=1933 RepID=UPI0020A254BE|nr:SAM-dependent methyltransferase [Streptoalloteichus tenebrarius]
MVSAEGVGSTSLLLAVARAAESRRPDRLFTDPYAAEFAAAAPALPDLPMESGARRTALADYLAVRTRFFDDSLVEAANFGCRQVVQLGAGLDTRAFRLDWPADTTVFEIDQPAVLEFKESVLERCAATPRSGRVVVPADLTAGWATALVDAGFDPAERTVWSAEGVLYYLTAEEGDRVMVALGERTAPGGRFVVEHITREVEGSVTLSGVRSELARRRAEWRSHVDDPVAWLRGHGWHVRLFTPNELLAASGRQPEGEGAEARTIGWLAVCER